MNPYLGYALIALAGVAIAILLHWTKIREGPAPVELANPNQPTEPRPSDGELIQAATEILTRNPHLAVTMRHKLRRIIARRADGVPVRLASNDRIALMIWLDRVRRDADSAEAP